MRPYTVLLGIVMGSTVSLAVGLVLTFVVFLFLPEYEDQIADERGPLLQAIAVFVMMAAAASAGFYGEVRQLGWRRPAQLATVVLVVLAAWIYWPRT